MASIPFSLDTAKKALRDEGFVDLRDLKVGQHIWEFEQKGFPFFTKDGLDFLQQRVLGNPDIRSIVEWFFEDKRCILAHCLRWGALPGHIECFLAGGRDAGRRVLMVQLLAKGSRVDYYASSHLKSLPTENGPRSTHELSPAALQQEGCKVHDGNFSAGGLVILDARLGRETRAGYAITVTFMIEDLVTGLPKMVLPNLPGLKEKVAEMESEKIGVNFAFGNVS
ncbi:hypothetical protein NCS57_00949000 [Fusarium keratoplasticum]|uniref:Uncharacterized protein n=1 Tax=Fusarium keratoplasticum TaxID=1328300 RepID=A0ACC0QS99_9HYPO|nr:hypothetical protein NCS57_00949000 [Fusarium keratoplasticum]KAI8663479.1 hypothetical protein NCS57_00949000 [Fusarium keratoplasticum]